VKRARKLRNGRGSVADWNRNCSLQSVMIRNKRIGPVDGGQKFLIRSCDEEINDMSVRVSGKVDVLG
jgi:hypothetical protein